MQSQKSLFQFQEKVSSSLTSIATNINGIQLFSPVALFYQNQVYAILPDLLYCFNAYRPTEENIVKIEDGFYSPIIYKLYVITFIRIIQARRMLFHIMH